MKPRLLALSSLLALAVSGCQPAPSDRVQGYVEGEYVYVSSPLSGALENLAVRRGAQVAQGAPLFALESVAETAARDQAARRLEEGEARLADARKGARDPELDARRAVIDQSRAALALAEKEFQRQLGLEADRVSTVQDLDRARSARDQERNRLAQYEADLKTASLGSRSDQIAGEEANVKALRATLARAEWDLAQKRQAAPATGVVFDTLFRRGEWVPAGRPVVCVLPPAGIKVRAFVPQDRVSTLRVGDPVRVSVDGAGEFAGSISFISPQVEYTPPVIYSQESRGKLVFMIEATFAPEIAARLHPGQPVDVRF